MRKPNLRLLSVRQLSELTGLSCSTIYKLVEAKMIPYIKLGKGKNSRVYFRKSQIERWLEEKEQPACYPAPIKLFRRKNFS